MHIKKIITFLPIFIISFFLSVAWSQEKVLSNIEINDFVIALSVEELVPLGIATKYSASVSRLYAFCEVTGALEETNLMHLWYYEGTLMASVKLPVKSKSWRTYSSKSILSEWTGQWRVDVTTEDGLLLSSSEFEIK
jgi:hypothetical protein